MDEKQYVVRGVDDVTPDQIESFWEERERGVVNLLAIGLTTRDVCNLRCVYCFGPDRRSQETQNTLTLDEYRSIIDEAAALGAQTAIYCSNGEPLMDPDLPQVVEYACSKGLKNAILTNATIIGNDHISQKVHGMSGTDLGQLLYDNDASLIMSIDSLDRDMYDRIVAVPGAYDWAQTALQRIQDIGFNRVRYDAQGRAVTRLLLSSVICKLNFHELPALRAYAHSIDAQFVCKLPSLLGRARDNPDLFFENNSTTRWIRTDYLVRMSDKKETVSSDTIGRCGVWHYGITVGNDGSIRQCFSIGDIGIGNIREKSLTELAAERQEKFAERLKNPGCVTKNADYSENSPP